MEGEHEQILVSLDEHQHPRKATFVCPTDPAEAAQCDSCQ